MLALIRVVVDLGSSRGHVKQSCLGSVNRQTSVRTLACDGGQKPKLKRGKRRQGRLDAGGSDFTSEALGAWKMGEGPFKSRGGSLTSQGIKRIKLPVHV